MGFPLPRSRPAMVASIVGFSVGAVLLGYWDRDPPSFLVEAPYPDSQPQSASGSDQSGPTPSELRQEADRLRAQNLQLSAELHNLRTSISVQSDGGPPSEGSSHFSTGADPDPTKPLPFPREAPEPYTPKGFEKVAHRAAAECGMSLDVVAVDCSEFPCIAWTVAKDETVARFTMTGCAPWEEAFKFGTVVVGAIHLSDGGPGPRYFSWMAVPPDPQDLLIALQRARERNKAMKEALGVR